MDFAVPVEKEGRKRNVKEGAVLFIVCVCVCVCLCVGVWVGVGGCGGGGVVSGTYGC